MAMKCRQLTTAAQNTTCKLPNYYDIHYSYSCFANFLNCVT